MTLARKTYYLDELSPGMEASVSKLVTEKDIQAFADVTGDHNPVHLDEAYAATTMFKTRIAHGMLTAGMFSAAFAMELPGPGCVYVSQTLDFKAPVRIGDLAIAKVKVLEVMEAKRRARFHCACYVDENLVVEGEAVLMVPRRKSA